MLHIECINATNCNTLKEGNLYYGFPTGGGALYVSRFPREGSHMGGYQHSRFNILTEEEFIVKKEVLEAKPMALVSELFEQEAVLENEGIIETTVEAERIVEEVVEEVLIEMIETLNVKKETFESGLTEKVYHYQYVLPFINRIYEVYGFIDSTGKAVLYKDAALTMLIGVTLRENVVIISKLDKEINLKDYPVFIRSITLGDLADISYIRNDQKVEVVQEMVVEELDLTDEEILSSEVYLEEGIQEPIVETELQESVLVESEEDQYEQLSIFDF